MHGGRIYEYSKRTGMSTEDILDFSANINPLGPPQSAMAAIVAALNGIRHYPDTRHAAAKEVVCARFEIPDSRAVFCGNGASEVIDLTLRRVQPKRVYVFEPAFSEYEAAAHRVGARVVHIPLEIFASQRHLSLRDALAAAAPQRNIPGNAPAPKAGDVVVVNNPHNPTGRCFMRAEVLELAEELCARGVVVLADESFLDFRADGGELTVIPWVFQMRTLVVVRSATKMYAIPGLRFGFGVAHPDLVARIEEHRDFWSVNHLAQAAATAGYQDEAFVQQTHQWIARETAYVQRTWGAHPRLQLEPPGANYFLVKLDSGIDVESVVSGLEHQGLFVRRCDDFRGLGSHHLRIAIRRHADNERLWLSFSDFLNRSL